MELQWCLHVLPHVRMLKLISFYHNNIINFLYVLPYHKTNCPLTMSRRGEYITSMAPPNKRMSMSMLVPTDGNIIKKLIRFWCIWFCNPHSSHSYQKFGEHKPLRLYLLLLLWLFLNYSPSFFFLL